MPPASASIPPDGTLASASKLIRVAPESHDLWPKTPTHKDLRFSPLGRDESASARTRHSHVVSFPRLPSRRFVQMPGSTSWRPYWPRVPGAAIQVLSNSFSAAILRTNFLVGNILGDLISVSIYSHSSALWNLSTVFLVLYAYI